MKQSEMAKALSLSKGEVSKRVKRGMPLTSVEDARVWISANAKEGIGHKSAAPSVTAAARAIGAKKPRTEPAPDDPDGLLHRRRDIERRAYAMIDEALKNAEALQEKLTASIPADPEALKAALANIDSAFASLPGLIRTYNQAAENAIQSEIRWEKHARAAGIVAPVSELRTIMTTTLEPLAAQLVNLARNVAPQANPQQPLVAERAIGAAVEAVLRQVSGIIDAPPEPAAPAST